MNTYDSIREADNKVMARFIDVDDVQAIVTIMYFDAPAANGWMLSPIHNTMAHLEVVALPALPSLCQSTIDAMDEETELRAACVETFLRPYHDLTEAFINASDFGRYS